VIKAELGQFVSGIRRGGRDFVEHRQELVCRPSCTAFGELFFGINRGELFRHGGTDELIDRNPLLLGETLGMPVE